MEYRDIDEIPDFISKASPAFDPKFQRMMREGEGDDDVAWTYDEVELKEQVEKAAARQKKKAAQRVGGDVVARGSGAAFSSSDPAAGGPPVRLRVFVPAGTDALKPHQAFLYLPPHSVILKHVKENRWRAPPTYYCATCSKSYGKGTGLTDFEAMVFPVRPPEITFCLHKHPHHCCHFYFY